jgi:hypothetical protein
MKRQQSVRDLGIKEDIRLLYQVDRVQVFSKKAAPSGKQAGSSGKTSSAFVASKARRSGK